MMMVIVMMMSMMMRMMMLMMRMMMRMMSDDDEYEDDVVTLSIFPYSTYRAKNSKMDVLHSTRISRKRCSLWASINSTE